jgi:hypothetical protein
LLSECCDAQYEGGAFLPNVGTHTQNKTDKILPSLTSNIILLSRLTLTKCTTKNVFRSTATSVGGTETIFYHMNDYGVLIMYVGP